MAIQRNVIFQHNSGIVLKEIKAKTTNKPVIFFVKHKVRNI